MFCFILFEFDNCRINLKLKEINTQIYTLNIRYKYVLINYHMKYESFMDILQAFYSFIQAY